jgi:hypothetical protein
MRPFDTLKIGLELRRPVLPVAPAEFAFLPSARKSFRERIAPEPKITFFDRLQLDLPGRFLELHQSNLNQGVAA